MQIILTQDVPHLGSLGDEVKVKDGYARNYLLPRGMALAANSKNADHLAHRRKRLEALRAEAIAQAKAESEKVAGMEVEIAAKAGANGRLFGSVTNRDLQAALKELGYELDRRSITLHAPIRNVGHYTATVRLHTDVKTDIGVKVVPAELTEEERAQQAAAAAAAEAGAEAPAEGAAAEGAEGEAAAAEGAEAAPAEGEQPAGPAPAVGETEAAPEGETPEQPA